MLKAELSSEVLSERSPEEWLDAAEGVAGTKRLAALGDLGSARLSQALTQTLIALVLEQRETNQLLGRLAAAMEGSTHHPIPDGVPGGTG